MLTMDLVRLGMDFELKKEILESCSKALGFSQSIPGVSVKHLRALRTSRGAAMAYRSKSALISMGYNKNIAEVASKSFVHKV
jgi:hypothetical protein